MNTSAGRGAIARWGWLITTLALGVVVIGSAWTNYESARNAAADVIRGETQIFRDVVFGANRPFDEGARVDFDSLVTAQYDAGLRYVAWVEADGTVRASGGEPAAAPLDLSNPALSGEPIHVGRRIRVFFSPRRPPEPSRGPGDSRRPPPDMEPPQQPFAMPPALVFEFEPVAASEMVARAFRTLLVAGVVAAVLMTGGIVFWRLSQRMEMSQRRMAEQRRLLALGEMSAVLAHEIRNPLASLKGHAQLLAERLPPDGPEHRKVARVVEEATRLEGLTADLLDFARSGPMDVQPADPAAVLRAAAADVSERITVDTAAAPSTWPLDERRMRLAVLANLFRNAMQAEPATAPPSARVAMEHGKLVFTIRDHGPGLPEGDEHRIFDPFFTTRTSGTGLGLPVAWRIVEAHGGTIEVRNHQQGGAEFRIVLPNPAS